MNALLSRRLALWCCFLSILWACTSIPVGAQTFEQGMERSCFNGPRIAELFRKSKEADAMEDESRYDIHRELAREEFRCSQNTSDPYVRDYSMYFYGSDLFFSLRTNGDVENMAPDIEWRMNELAASTRFPDIKRLAIKLRDDIKQAITSAHNAIYGTPQPSPEPEYTPPKQQGPNKAMDGLNMVSDAMNRLINLDVGKRRFT